VTTLKPNAPLHIRESFVTEWARHFAWLPTRTEQRTWVWLRWTWKRSVRPPAWFIPPAPADGWNEYSDDKRGYWEL